MQTFRVSHAALFSNPLRGVEVKVPTGTRSLRLVPSAAAVPVEVWPDSQPPDAKTQDGQLFWSPGETLYPGDSLRMKAGITTVFVRLPPSNNAGAQAWIMGGGSAQPWGEDARRGTLYGGTAYQASDLVNGPAPTSDGQAASLLDGQLTFVASDDVQLHSSPALSTLPATLRLPGAFVGEGTFANLPNRASVTGTLHRSENDGGTSDVGIIAPHYIAPVGLLLRHQRVRLRITAGQAWDSDDSAMRFARLVRTSSAVPSSAWAAFNTPHGCCRPPDESNVPQQTMGDGFTSWTIDVGCPSDLFALGTAYDDTWWASLVWPHSDVSWYRRPSVAVEWLFDNSPSRPGSVEARTELTFAVDAGLTYSAACVSPNGRTSVKVTFGAGAAGDAEVRAWPLDHAFAVDLSTTPAFAVPLADVAGTAFTLPQGTWCVGVFGGTTGGAGRLWTEEG